MISLQSSIVLIVVCLTYPLLSLSISCTFCPDGSSPSRPNLGFPGQNVTCGDYANYLNSLEDDDQVCQGFKSGPDFSLVVGACGCPNITGYESCYNECSDYVPDREIPGENGNSVSCKFLFEYAPWIQKNSTDCPRSSTSFLEQMCGCGCNNGDCGKCDLCDGKYNAKNEVDSFLTCENLSNFLKGTKSNDTCFPIDPRSLYQCECPVPQGSCSLCDGDIPDKNKVIGDITCLEAMYYAASEQNQTKECDNFRSVAARACDCSTAPAAACDVTCPPGKKFEILQKYNSTLECGQALFETNLELGENCDSESFLDPCCVDVSAAPTDAPTDAPTSAPTNDPTDAPTSASFVPNFVTRMTLLFLLVTFL